MAAPAEQTQGVHPLAMTLCWADPHDPLRGERSLDGGGVRVGLPSRCRSGVRPSSLVIATFAFATTASTAASRRAIPAAPMALGCSPCRRLNPDSVFLAQRHSLLNVVSCRGSNSWSAPVFPKILRRPGVSVVGFCA